MEEILKELVRSVNGLHDKINNINDALQQCEKRLFQLEKMDSIEHRVTVNQIDLTDIKEIVETVANFQREELLDLSQQMKTHMKSIPFRDELNLVHKRLDFQLNKISKNEEAILIYSSSNT
jgi:DNA repair ATPase RecN